MIMQEKFQELNLLMEKGFWAEAIELVYACPALVKYCYPGDESRGVLSDAVCYDGASELVRTMLKFGANPNSQCNCGSTPLGNAIYSGHRYGLDNFENIKLLVSEGAGLSLLDDTGNPPLHSAVSEGRRDVVELLLSAGADPSQKNLYGDDIWQWMDWLKDWRMKDLFPK